MDNMARWHKIAEIEHGKSCTKRGNCEPHLQAMYEEMIANGQ